MELNVTPPQGHDLGLNVPPGGQHYRAYVGPPEDYDLISAMTFTLLIHLGLRQQHKVLDIGCGSLRAGRLLIPYLNPWGYTGIEPNRWLVERGIELEVGTSQVAMKSPQFIFADSAASLIGQQYYDFLIAQSIFSHCGADLFDRWLREAAQLMTEDGVLAATYVRSTVDTDRDGWIYPECVGFTESSVDRLAKAAGLEHHPLTWHHPRQVWSLFTRPSSDFSWYRGRELSWNTCFERLDARRQLP